MKLLMESVMTYVLLQLAFVVWRIRSLRQTPALLPRFVVTTGLPVSPLEFCRDYKNVCCHDRWACCYEPVVCRHDTFAVVHNSWVCKGNRNSCRRDTNLFVDTTEVCVVQDICVVLSGIVVVTRILVVATRFFCHYNRNFFRFFDWKGCTITELSL